MLSERLYKLRKAKGLSQEDLANQLNVSRQSVSKWELGESNPDLNNIIALAKIYDCSTDYLLSGMEDEKEIAKTAKDGRDMYKVMTIIATLFLFLPLLVIIGIVSNNHVVFTFLLIFASLAIVGSIMMFVVATVLYRKTNLLHFKNSLVTYVTTFYSVTLYLFLYVLSSAYQNDIFYLIIYLIVILGLSIYIRKLVRNIFDAKWFMVASAIIFILNIVYMAWKGAVLIISPLSISFIIYGIGLYRLKLKD